MWGFFFVLFFLPLQPQGLFHIFHDYNNYLCAICSFFYQFCFCCCLANSCPSNSLRRPLWLFPADLHRGPGQAGEPTDTVVVVIAEGFSHKLFLLFQLNQNTSVLLLVMSWPRNCSKLLPWETPTQVQGAFLVLFFLMLKLKNSPRHFWSRSNQWLHGQSAGWNND